MPTLGLRADPPLAAWPSNGLIGILDLEYTAWDGSASRSWSQPWEWREIVQIGLILADAGQGFTIRNEVEILVRPQRNPVLSDYFVALTGITQSRIEEAALSFGEALTALPDLGAEVKLIIFNGCDGEVLRENCALHAVAQPWAEERLFDFRPLLAHTLARPQNELISSELPRLAGVSVSGCPHSALHDCRAICAAFASWRTSGVL